MGWGGCRLMSVMSADELVVRTSQVGVGVGRWRGAEGIISIPVDGRELW